MPPLPLLRKALPPRGEGQHQTVSDKCCKDTSLPRFFHHPSAVKRPHGRCSDQEEKRTHHPLSNVIRVGYPELAFTQPALPEQAGQVRQFRNRATGLHMSEIMTLLIAFHQSSYRQFKAYYTNEILGSSRGEFPQAPKYSRFVELMPRALLPLAVYLYHSFEQCTGISFVDSTKLEVCRIQRANTHRVFKENAALGKTSMGWFYGFKWSEPPSADRGPRHVAPVSP